MRYQPKPQAADLFADPNLQGVNDTGTLVDSHQRIRGGALLMARLDDFRNWWLGRPPSPWGLARHRARARPIDGARRRMASSNGWLAIAVVALCLVSAPVDLCAQSTPASMQQLTVDAGSPEAKVRRQALRALRERGGPEALALLGRLVGDPEVDIREGAIEAVIRLYVHPPAKRSMKNAEDAFLFAPYRTTPYPVPAELSTALVKALADDYESVRRDAAYAVGITMTPPVPDPVAFELVASLSDKFPAVRIAAAQVLGRLRVFSAGVPLIGRINDEALDVRLAAMRAVGDVRDLRAVAALTEQFEFYVRGVAGRAAIDALARIADKQSRPLFEAQTDSSYPAHRRSAYEGLGGSAISARQFPASRRR